MARDLSQLLSPGQHVHLSSMPWYPFCIFHGGGFRVIGCWRFVRGCPPLLCPPLLWPWPIRIVLHHSLSSPGWPGHLVGSVHPGISFWAVVRGWWGLSLVKVRHLFCWLGKQASCSMMLPGDLPFIVLKTGISGIGKFLSASNFQSASGWGNGHSHKGVLMGVPCKGNISSHESHFVVAGWLICSMLHGSKFSMGIRSTSIGWSPFLLCLWQCRWPLMLEAFFDGVLGFLANVLFCPLLAVTPPRQPPQLMYVLVEFCYLLPGRVRADELHGSRFCPQVLFCWWFPSAPKDCTVMLAPAGGNSMEEHLLI